MRSTIRRTTLIGLGLAAAISLAACSKSGGGGNAITGPSADAPVVSNFQVRALTPQLSGQTVEYLVTATVVDPNGDLLGGQVEARVVSTGEVIGATIDAGFFDGQQFAGVLFFQNPPGGHVELVFSVIDAAGHRSNEIPFAVDIAMTELPRTRPAGPPSGGFRPAR
jgi:hypothetical protein